MDKAQPPDIISAGPPGVPPAPPPPPPSGRPRDEDRLTRKPLSLWDRIKFLVLLVLLAMVTAAVGRDLLSEPRLQPEPVRGPASPAAERT